MKDIKKSRSLKSNFVINVFGAVVPLAISLVTVPIYVRHIGDARYGVLSIVWILLGYLGFLDLGLSRAAANALAKLPSASQPERARVLMTTFTLNLGLGLIGGICLGVFGKYLLQHMLAVPETLGPEISQAFPWIGAMLPLAMVGGVAVGALESREQFVLVNMLQLLGSSLGQIVPVILVVIIGPSLAIVIPATAITRLLFVLTILFVVDRNEGPLLPTGFDRDQTWKLLSYGGWVSASSLISPILTSLDQLMIGRILGVSAITYYSIPMNLVSRSQIFAGALSRTLFPRMSSVAADEARKLASRAMLALAFGYGAIVAPAIILAPAFLEHWISIEFAKGAAPVAQILFWGAWINGLAFVPYELLQSQGRPDITGKFHAAEVLPFVAILWGLTSAFGIVGAALAWSLRCAVDTACLTWAAKPPKRSLWKIIVPPIFLFAASNVTAHYVQNDIWIAMVAATIAGTAFLSLGALLCPDLRIAIFYCASRTKQFAMLNRRKALTGTSETSK